MAHGPREADPSGHPASSFDESRPHQHLSRHGIILLLISLATLCVLGVLTVAAHNSSVLPGDLRFARELQEQRGPFFFDLFYAVSYIGYSPLSEIIFVAVPVVLWLFGLRLEAVYLVAASGIADIIASVIKVLVGRPRPSPTLIEVVQRLSDNSFPSGHVVHYTVFYGFLAFIFATIVPRSWWSNLLFALCVTLIALVGLSRVYLGEHWPTDILGGYLIGGLCLMAVIALYPHLRKQIALSDAHWLRWLKPR